MCIGILPKGSFSPNHRLIIFAEKEEGMRHGIDAKIVSLQRVVPHSPGQVLHRQCGIT